MAAVILWPLLGPIQAPEAFSKLRSPDLWPRSDFAAPCSSVQALEAWSCAICPGGLLRAPPGRRPLSPPGCPEPRRPPCSPSGQPIWASGAPARAWPGEAAGAPGRRSPEAARAPDAPPGAAGRAARLSRTRSRRGRGARLPARRTGFRGAFPPSKRGRNAPPGPPRGEHLGSGRRWALPLRRPERRAGVGRGSARRLPLGPSAAGGRWRRRPFVVAGLAGPSPVQVAAAASFCGAAEERRARRVGGEAEPGADTLRAAWGRAPRLARRRDGFGLNRGWSLRGRPTRARGSLGPFGGGIFARVRSPKCTISSKMSDETIPEEVSALPAQSQHYFDRFSEDDPEYLRIRNMAADLRQDFNLMEQKKRVTLILQSPSFREELESLIQEQIKKGNNSNIWALQQIAEFMATTAPSVFPPSPLNLSTVTPINDLHSTDSVSLAKGERLMRCKVSSVYRLLDLYGWAQLSGTTVTLRVSKEQEHFLVCPEGLSCHEVTASSLIKVNILGKVVEQGSSSFSVDTQGFSLHSAIYAARPDVRCIIHLHTPATTAVSAMKQGLLPISHDALLAGDMVYFDFNGEMEGEADRIELQKCLGPTCKVLVLRNHGLVTLGDTVEEAFYKVFHLQAACEVQVAALSSAGGPEHLILLEAEKHRPHDVGLVRWAGSTFGPMQKSRLGEHEFEALMRMLDNLGYRTGYAYRYPFVQEKTRHKSEVEIPATVTAFVFEEEAGPIFTLRQHAQKQQKEKTRWLNTPNTYLRVKVAEDSQGGAKATWMKADDVEKSSSGMPIRIENPNQFVPLYTDPQEVLEMRNKIREQNRQEVKSAGPQSQLLASVIAEQSRSPSTESHLADGEMKDDSRVEASLEPESPNPFSQLTDQELEEYKKEVERKKLGLDGEKKDSSPEEGVTSPEESTITPPEQSPTKPGARSPARSPSKAPEGGKKPTDLASADKAEPEAVVVNGKEDDQTVEEHLSKGISQLTTNADTTEGPKDKTKSVTSGPVSPEGSPSKSPSKKKKKFRAPSFLKKSKKKEKAES